MLSKKHQSAFESNTAFMVKIEDLVREIAIQNNIPYYRIESRMEHYAHMGADDSYMPVIRIITYFEDTVDQITEILRTELDMVAGKSIDKKKNRIDSFSYKHAQYFASLKANRTGLIEYKRMGNKKFELQLCSMLQDAWSGIEKELGYDSASFPDESKRDFYRVGALLEMADIEFLKIRTEAAKATEVHTEPVSHHETIADAVQPVATPAAEPVNTFVGHLQAVAQEIPAPVAEVQPIAEVVPEVIAHVEPVMEQPQVIAEPDEVVHEVIAEVAPIVEPVKIIEPVVAADPVVVNPVAVNLIVPRRAMPDAPKPVAPLGIAPLRIKVPVLEPENDGTTSTMNVDRDGTLADHAEEKIADIVNSAPLVEKPAPAQQEEPQTVIVNVVTPVVETPKPAPVPEPVAPVADIISTVIPEVIIPKKETPVINVNNSVPKTPDATPQATVPTPKPPFFEEQTRTNKVVLDENAPMNDSSLREYVMSSNLLKEIDTKIAERAGAKINPDIDIEGDVERLRFLKVFTLKQLTDRLADNKNDIVSFAEKWIGKDNGGSFDSGISLFYLEYLLVGKKNDPAFAIEYVVKFISDNDYSARYIIPTYNSIRSTETPSNFSHLTLKA